MFHYIIMLVIIVFFNIVCGFAQDAALRSSSIYNNMNNQLKVDFDDTQFDSIAEFRNTKFVSQAYFRNAQFDSIARFNNARFSSEAYFKHAQFNSYAVFSEAQFISQAFFNEAKFSSIAGFWDTQFDLEASFLNAQFDSQANFYFAKFNSKADFEFAKFNSIAHFENTQFDSIVDFRNTKFDSIANFRHAQFNSEVYFWKVQFNAEADFSDSKFDSIAYFNRARFNSKVDFSYCKLPSIIVFSEVIAKDIINLSFCTLDSSIEFCYIDLRRASIDKLLLRYDKFRIYKPDTITTNDFEEYTSIYEGLLKNFKDHGYWESYKTLDKEYQSFKLTQNPNHNLYDKAAGYMYSFVNKAWNDYGYDKGRIWNFTITFLSFFFLLNWIFFPYLVVKVYPIPTIKHVFNQNKKLRAYRIKHGTYPKFNIFAPFLSFSFTLLVFFGLKLSVDNLNFKHQKAVTYLLFQYIVGLICLAYLANFVISVSPIGI